MDTLEAIDTRRSIRKFKDTPLSEEAIRTIVNYAAKAPSANNMQMWKFLAVTNRDVLSSMKDAIIRKLEDLSEKPAAKAYSTFFVNAPVTIVVLSKTQSPEKGHRPDMQSMGAAIENFCLASHALGYGTCWMTGPCIAREELGEILRLESPWKVAALLPLGVPNEAPSARPRKPLEEVLEFIK